MIKNRLIYALYNLELNKEITNLKKLIQEQQLQVAPVLTFLKKYQEIIDLYTNISFETLLTYTRKEQIESIVYPIMPVYSKGFEVSFKAVKMYVSNYARINKNITGYQSELKRKQKQKIPYATFNLIIKKANNKVADKIIKDNYLFEPVKRFGSIGIIVNHNNRRRINWGESTKAKNKLIAEGKIPYCKKEALQAKKENKEYLGVPYLVSLPATDYYFHWFKKAAVIKYNVNMQQYIFKPARGEHSIVKKLNIFKKTTKNISLIYTRMLNKNYYESTQTNI